MNAFARRWIPLAIAFGAPLAVLTLVRYFVVNVPFLDEWQWTPMMVQLHHGFIVWDQILPLHNEQRIVVPSLIAAALAAGGHGWVVARETTASVGLLLATLAVWWAVIVRIVPVARREWTLAFISLLACSLTQAENWTWGFQLSFFIANLCAAVITLCFIMTERRWSLPLGLAALIVTSYSVAFGFTAIPAGMFFYGLTRQRWKFIAWTIAGAAILILYRMDFHASLYRSVDAPLVSRVVATITFALAALGAPIARGAGLVWCELAGALAIAALAAYGFAAWHRPRNAGVTAAILALAVMPAAGAFEIAFGRLAEGLPAALGGRFTTSTSLLWIAIVFVAAQLDTRRLRVAMLSAVPLAGLWLFSQAGGYAEFRDRSLDLFAAAQAIPRWNSASEDEFPALWPAEVELSSLYDVRDGPFLNP